MRNDKMRECGHHKKKRNAEAVKNIRKRRKREKKEKKQRGIRK